MRLQQYINEKLIEFYYLFPGISDQGTFTVKAKNEKTARNKIKKEWGISSLPNNIKIWEK